MGVGGPRERLENSSARLSRQGRIKDQVVALPGSPQSRRPRHPYMQPIGLPKEGQRVGVERMRNLDNRAGDRWLRSEGPGVLRSRRRKRPPTELRQPRTQGPVCAADGTGKSCLSAHAPQVGTRGLEEEEDRKWSRDPAVSARVGGQTGVFCLSSRSGSLSLARVFRSGGAQRPPHGHFLASSSLGAQSTCGPEPSSPSSPMSTSSSGSVSTKGPAGRPSRASMGAVSEPRGLPSGLSGPSGALGSS